jgi:AraC-like DNA-binding protein
MANTVLSVNCRVLLQACRQAGLDTQALLASVGLEPGPIEDPDGRVPPERVAALWEAAEEATGDPHLALRAVRSVAPGDYRVIEYLMQSAPTVGAGLSKIGEYFAWIDTSVELPIVERDELFGCSIDIHAPPSFVPLRAVEFTFGTCLRKLQSVASEPLRPARIDIATAPPADRRPLEAFFDCPLEFGAEDNRLLFERATWNVPLRTGDPILLGMLEKRAKELVQELRTDSELQARVRKLLIEGGPMPSVAEVAKRLGMSARTLQRRLGEEGATFAALIDDARATLARSLADDPKIALLEIAFLLGFSDQSSFTRSFKRWTGQTPAAYRHGSR